MINSEQLFDGKYKILKLLGKGGMGAVYLAENVKLGTLWAIKEVNKKASDKIDLLAEPNILKKLNHPALPRIFDIIDDSNNIYIIEDYIEGVSLDKQLPNVGRFPEKTVIEWAKQICDVLIYLHSLKPNPIIYRDMKPANIIITPDGKIKLIDFGIAREYKKESDSDTTYMGTRGYAAPEQYGTFQSDARTDIYALGVTLYHLITGKSPNEPPFELKPVRHFDKKFSRGIENILLKCTRQDPKQRYQSVNKLLNDLNNIQKFNVEYRRKIIINDIKKTLIVISLIFFSYLTYAGFIQIDKEKLDEYNSKINEGFSLLSEKNYDKAQKSFEAATVSMPEKINGYRGIADVYLKKYDYEGCIEYITNEVFSKVKLSYSDPDILYILGTSYFEIKDYENAVLYIQRAKDIKPDNSDYSRDLGVSLARLGKLDEAESILKDMQVRGIDEEVSVYVTGEVLAAKKNFNDAVKNFEACINQTQKEELKKKSYISIARIYRDNPKAIAQAVEKEIEVLEKANSVLNEKNNIIIIEMLGEAYFNKGMQIEEASAKKDLLLKSSSNFELLLDLGYKRSYVYRNIGIIYQQINEFSKSEDILNKMKKEYPDDFKSYIQLAFLYLDMEALKPKEKRNYSRVTENYEKALKLCPDGENSIEILPLANKIKELKDKGWIN